MGKKNNGNYLVDKPTKMCDNGFVMQIEDINLVNIAECLVNEEEAIKFFESIRWPDGPICPHCGGEGYHLTAKPDSKRPGRKGLLKCRACRKQFSVRVGTIFEDSKIPLGKWLMAIHLMCSSKKGISALQLKRNLKIAYQTSWFMCHRIRHAMTQEPLAGILKGVVEVDETYVGGKPRRGAGKGRTGRGTKKTPVMALIERGGAARVRPIERVNAATLKGEIRKHVDPSARINTDDFASYRGIGSHFAGGHRVIRHSKGEYAAWIFGEPCHVNSAESFFALLKRGHYGVFHQWSKKHLHRYCNEFVFRWNLRKLSDGERTVIAIMGSVGKRLMYKQPMEGS